MKRNKEKNCFKSQTSNERTSNQIEKYMKKFFVLIITIVPLITFAQSVSFVNTPSDARSAAMGNATYALSGVAFVTHHNSASVFFSEYENSAGISYMSWQPDVAGCSQINIGAHFRTLKYLGMALGYKHNILPETQLYDENGNPLGNFTPKENAIDIGFAFRVSERFSISTDLRYIRSIMSTKNEGSAVAFNLNTMYSANNLNLAFGISNIGSKIDYGYNKYDLPATVKAGAVYSHISEKQRFTFSGEVDYLVSPSDYRGLIGGVGIEYMFNNTLAIRGGYHVSDKSKTGPSYASLGAGVNVNILSFNAAYWLAGSDNPANKSFLISLSINF